MLFSHAILALLTLFSLPRASAAQGRISPSLIKDDCSVGIVHLYWVEVVTQHSDASGGSLLFDLLKFSFVFACYPDAFSVPGVFITTAQRQFAWPSAVQIHSSIAFLTAPSCALFLLPPQLWMCELCRYSVSVIVDRVEKKSSLTEVASLRFGLLT